MRTRSKCHIMQHTETDAKKLTTPVHEVKADTNQSFEQVCEEGGEEGREGGAPHQSGHDGQNVTRWLDQHPIVLRLLLVFIFLLVLTRHLKQVNRCWGCVCTHTLLVLTRHLKQVNRCWGCVCTHTLLVLTRHLKQVNRCWGCVCTHTLLVLTRHLKQVNRCWGCVCTHTLLVLTRHLKQVNRCWGCVCTHTLLVLTRHLNTGQQTMVNRWDCACIVICQCNIKCILCICFCIHIHIQHCWFTKLFSDVGVCSRWIQKKKKEKGETCFKFHWDLNLHLLAQMSSANQLTMVLPGKWGHSYITLPLPYRANHLLQHYCVNWREVLHILQLHRTFVPRNPHSYFHLNRLTGPQAEPQIIHGADMDTQTETSFFVRQTLFITITVLCKSQNLVCRSYPCTWAFWLHKAV